MGLTLKHLLTVSCISTLIFLEIYSQFLSARLLLSTTVHDSSSVIRAGVQRLRVCTGVQPDSKLQSSVLVPKAGQTVYTSRLLFSLLPLSPSQAESVPITHKVL